MLFCSFNYKSYCWYNGVLQVFFTRPHTTAAPPAPVIAEETSALTADHMDHVVEPVAVLTTDSGFTHAREQYTR